MTLSARKLMGACAGALVGISLSALIAGAAIAGAPFGRSGPSPAVPAAPLKAFTKVKNPKNFEGVWLIYSTGGAGPYSNPPMSAAGQARVAAFRAKYNEADMRANPPNGACVEPGMPSAMGGIGLVPMDIHMAPDRITIISEVGPLTRRIFMDPKRTPPDGYPTSRAGWSNAHWEGDTLVITTSLMTEWLMGRWSHTDDAVLTERLTLRNSADLGKDIPRNQPLDPLDPVSPLTLVSEYTMHDPALYDVDPKGTLYFRQMPTDEFQDISCVEGLFWETMNSKWRKKEG